MVRFRLATGVSARLQLNAPPNAVSSTPVWKTLRSCQKAPASKVLRPRTAWKPISKLRCRKALFSTPKVLLASEKSCSVRESMKFPNSSVVKKDKLLENCDCDEVKTCSV